jgi:hypothetical protein
MKRKAYIVFTVTLGRERILERPGRRCGQY